MIFLHFGEENENAAKNTRSRCVALNGRDIHHTHLLVIEATGPGEIYTFSGVKQKETKPAAG